jgi:hypothetical protein
MAKCPFAEWKPISGSCGSFVGGKPKIVHHTTEGSNAAAALAAFKAKKADPHFTVDGTRIYQHIDTDQAARALRNAAGGSQTNRSRSVQIEVVGFAGKRKGKKTLTNVARLCRWLEAQHDIPLVWPNGVPKPASGGADPGGHNRNAAHWNGEAGHFGHCHVPENTHWDPAYDKVEVDFLMAAKFGADGKLANPQEAAVKTFLDRPDAPLSAAPPQVMEDHFDVGDTDEDGEQCD